MIEKGQTWHMEGKQSLDKDKAQSEREFVSGAVVWSRDSAETLKWTKRKWGKQIDQIETTGLHH